MIIIIHGNKYIVNTDFQDIQVLINEGLITQEEAEAYFEMACIAEPLNATVEIKHGSKELDEQ